MANLREKEGGAYTAHALLYTVHALLAGKVQQMYSYITLVSTSTT